MRIPNAIRSGLRWLVPLLGLVIPGSALAEGEGSVFTWHPSMRVTGVVDDNLQFEDNGSGSVGVWVAPRVELDYRAQGLAAGADLGIDYRYYGDEPVNDLLYRAVGWGEVGLGYGFTVGLSNAFVPQAFELGRPEDDVANLVQTNRVDADVTWRREMAFGSELAAGAVATHYHSEDFAETVPLPGGGFSVDPDFQPDFVQGLVFGELQHTFGERNDTFVRGQFSYRDYTEISLGDNANFSALIGVRSRRFDALELELSGGGGAVAMDADNGWRAVANAHARYRWDFGLSAWATVRHLSSPDLIAEQTHQTGGEIGFEQRFGPATALQARIFATRFAGDPRGSGGNLFGAGEIRMRRQLTQLLQASVTYRHWRNGGSLSLDDFNQNRVGVELGFRL